MEVEFLSNMRYSLYASEEEWRVWHGRLSKFADFIDRASQLQLGQPAHSLVSGTPLSNPTKPPSPPMSEHDALIASRHVSIPSPMAPFLPQAIHTPTSLPPPESDVRLWQRKRSLDENQVEPPAKRMYPYASSATSNSTLTPSTLSGDLNSPLPRLPAPAAQHQASQQITPVAHLPPLPASRAMPSVYPPPNRRPQGTPLPALQPPQYLPRPTHSNSGSPSVDLQNRHASHASMSGTSSPAYPFPAPQASQTLASLSPSGMSLPRNSPYKPVRGVNTLLVPPPSATVYQAPQQVSFNQMHYQPLGKPMSERRTGVLPLLPFDTWSQSHHLQPQYLPQPQLPA